MAKSIQTFYIYTVYSILISICIILNSCSDSQEKNYNKSLTADKLLQIELGMTKAEVKNLLGKPIYENLDLFEYTIRKTYNFPMVWIHFEENKVTEVYVKMYYYLEERGIYGMTKDPKTGLKFQWGKESLSKYIH